MQEKLEIRVRSPGVTPGYWRQPELTAAAFDEEGFYRLGDAVRLIDERDPTRGLVFDGRIGEDFKLSNGTWVSVGPLRADVIAALSPFAQDVVIAGLDADYVAALIVPDVAACTRALATVAQPSLRRDCAECRLLKQAAGPLASACTEKCRQYALHTACGPAAVGAIASITARLPTRVRSISARCCGIVWIW